MSQPDILGLLHRLVHDAEKIGVSTLQEFLAAIEAKKLGHPLGYGGHTPCTEISHRGKRCFVDFGSGLREAGTKYMSHETEYTFFITHMHWDHLIGLNFFIPVFIPGYKITIYHVHKNAPEYIKLMFNGINFPVKWADLSAAIEFVQVKVYDKVQVGDMTVSPFSLDHPGGSFGWRFDAANRSVAIGYDGEYKRLSRTDLGKDLPYFQNLDLLLFDAQYDLVDAINRHDWGHSSAPLGVDLALREGIKNVAFLHHDPWSSDEKLRISLARARAYCAKQLANYPNAWHAQPEGPNIFMAYDTLVVDLELPIAAELRGVQFRA
jgi:phosphoribosyl 1,2-cyclic phosphodiesterase